MESGEGRGGGGEGRMGRRAGVAREGGEEGEGGKAEVQFRPRWEKAPSLTSRRPARGEEGE